MASVTNFKIDGVAMTFQPSKLEATPPRSTYTQMAGGGHTATRRPRGHSIRVTWGVDVSPNGTLAELRSAHAGTASHTIAWTDEDSVETSVNVFFDVPGYNITTAELTGAITIQFRERSG